MKVYIVYVVPHGGGRYIDSVWAQYESDDPNVQTALSRWQELKDAFKAAGCSYENDDGAHGHRTYIITARLADGRLAHEAKK